MATMTETTESAVAVLIPLDKLKKSLRNARRTAHTEAAIEALAASIHAKGMLQNLVVEPELDKEGNGTGYFFVTAGEGRRLAQLLRVKRKQIRKDEPIRCLVDATHDAHELSLDGVAEVLARPRTVARGRASASEGPGRHAGRDVAGHAGARAPAELDERT